MTSQHKITSNNIRKLFAEIAKSIMSSLDISDISRAVMNQIDLFFQPRFSSLFRLDAETQELYFMVTKGINLDEVKDVRLKMGEGIVGYVAKTGKALIITDTQNDSRFSQKIDNLTRVKTKSLIAVPVTFQNKLLGVIELINTLGERGFSKDELTILETIADFAAIAMTNAMTYQRVLWYSQHDPLTGLYNRSHLVKQLTQQHDSSMSQYAIAVLIDVDKFKEVNDTNGHLIGDQVLIKLGGILNSLCRKNDFAYRIGGDEFLIMILDLNENETQSVMQRVQEKLQASLQSIAPAQGFSFGMTAGHQSDFEKLIHEADNQMYLKKMNTKKSERIS